MRAGVAGGVLSTLAVAGASGSANAAETTQTLDLSALTADLATQVAQSADATQQAAANYELQAERDAAAAKAAQQAKADLADAKAKAAAKKKAADEAARKAAAEEAASRSAERTTLSSSDSASTSVSAPASGSVATVIAFLKAQVGDAYVMGGTGPNSWDCSGLVQAAFKQAGCGPAARLGGPVDGRYAGVAVQPRGRGHPVLGFGRFGVPRGCLHR